MLNKTNKKFLLGAVLSMAVCFAACSEGNSEVTETAENTVSAAETEAADTSDGNSDGEDELSQPLTADPVSAVKAYLQELSKDENVKSLELRGTEISQTGAIAYKYYESPLAEEFGVAEGVNMIPVNVDYRIEYSENSGFQSGEKSEYFIVKSDENGLAVVDRFACEPKEYRGEVKEVLTDEKFHAEHYLVELDGGLGTVECINAAFFNGFEEGTRIYIYANGDIYGDPPRIDAVSILSESELSDDE